MQQSTSARALRSRHALDTLLPVLAIVALWLLLLPPLTQRGYMTCSHDGALHLLRAFQLDELVRQGVMWPRWAPGMVLGYGYPLFNFHPALSLYPSLILHRLGFSLLQGWNLSLALSLLASGLTMYLWARQIVGPYGGFVAAVAFMFAPYQLYDVYWRGSIAESLTLPLFPLVLWAALRVARECRWRYTVLGAIAYAAVFLMHAPASLMLTLVLLAYQVALVWRAHNRRAVALQMAAMMILALGLAAFFLVPAFLERDQVQFARAITPGGQNFHNHFLSLTELFGHAPASDPGLVNPSLPRSLGLATSLLAVLGILGTWLARARLGEAHKHNVLWATLILIGLVMMMLPVSEPFWSHVPLLPFIQFPWRFLGAASLLASLLAEAGLASFDTSTRGRSFIVGLAIVTLVVGALPWAYPRLCSAADEPTQASYIAYEKNTGLLGMTSSAEYLPIAVQELPTDSPMAESMLTGQPVMRWNVPGARIIAARDDGLAASLILESDAPVRVTYHAFYFPGWQARMDDQPVAVMVMPPYGAMAVDVPAGRHTLTLRFESTPLRTASEIISILAAAMCVVLAILDKRSLRRVTPPAPSVPYREWLGLIALGLILVALKTSVIDHFDTPLRWRRLQADQFKGAAHTLSGIIVADRARLLGYDVNPPRVASGDVAYVDLYWTLDRPVKLRTAVRLLDEQGLLWSDKNELEILGGGYSVPPPSSEWPPGTWADDRHAMRILPGAPPGIYQLVVVPFHPDTLEPRPATGGRPAPGDYPGVSIGVLEVIEPARQSNPRDLDFAVQVREPLGSDLTLVGYSQDRDEVASGETMLVTLGWQAARQPKSDYKIRLELIAQDGQVATQLLAAPGGERYPTSRWKSGQIVRSRILARVSGRVASGQYDWRVTLLDGNGSPVGQARLGKLIVHAPQRVMTAPTLPTRLNTQLGDWVSLAGFDVPTSLATGQTMTVTLVWQALRETDQDYKVFVHLLSADGRVVAQSDAVPAGWTRPTSGWLAGEYVTDVHVIEIKQNLPPGSYRLMAGMYSTVTGQRLATTGGADTIVLGAVELLAR